MSKDLRRSERIARRTKLLVEPNNTDLVQIDKPVSVLRGTMTTHDTNTHDMINQDDNISKSKQSLRSARSQHSRTSAASQLRLLEARAAREEAELERQRLEVQREHLEQEKRQRLEAQREQLEQEKRLEEKRLAAEKALIRARLQEEIALLDNSSSTSTKKSHISDLSRVRTERWVEDSTSAQVVGKKLLGRPSAKDLPTCAPVVGEKLLGRLSAKDLPTFSGDPLDWLRFKNAYETTTKIGQYSDQENVSRLQRCLHGQAWEAVAARLITATSAAQVMKILEMRFGRPDLILNKLIGEMKRLPKLTGTGSEIVTLATKVDNCVAAIQATGHVSYLYSPELVTEIISKMTESIYLRWMDFTVNLDSYEPRLPALAKYLMKEADCICRSGTIDMIQKVGRLTCPSGTKRPLLLTTAEENSNDAAVNVVSEHQEKKCPFCEKEGHLLDNCTLFKNEDVNKRWVWICQKRLCFKCLSSRHRRDRCKSKKKCATCKAGHHSLLHRHDWTNNCQTEKKENSETTANIWANDRKKIYLKVLPVTIEGPVGSVHTYALLDEGSTVTLVESHIAEEVGATGPQDKLNLQGAVGEENNILSRTVTLTIRTEENVHSLDHVRTVDNLTLPNYVVTKEQLAQYEHLKGIPLHVFSGRPKLLIGQDNWHLIISREIREGKKNEPVASRTQLGWVLHGFSSSITKSNFPSFSFHLHQDDDLHELVKDYFRLDSIGVKYEDHPKHSKSLEERRALDILQTKTKRIGDRWETGLLWRADDVELPDNKRNAEHRLRIIEKMMDADSNFAADYTKQVENMLEKNYAEEVYRPVTGKRIWYLPHFGVRNPNKPGKLRLVFDAKAETKGISLNSELLAGPDLLNSLLGVLFKFRERAVAVTADIREMFLQVKIIEEDQNAQCFLWRGMERKKPPRTYKMTSMTFGAKSSPCTATYILRHNAEDYAHSHPRSVEAIKRRHYVDDYLDSVEDEDEMKQLVNDVIMIHKAGGFEIRGWASNRPNVLPTQSSDSSINLLQQTDTVERTLGLNWKPGPDVLGFDLSFKKIDKEVVQGMRRPTKREMLRVVMSIFDPLGLLSPFIIRGKIILQFIWRSGIQWDEQLDEKAAQAWFLWLQDLQKCRFISIPRCYGFRSMNGFQLHVFVDASEQAYAAVAYLRRDNEVAFVAAKCRVAPLKSSTIPRLELQAALMGTRLGVAIEREHGIVIDRRFFWTDSQTVWQWINNPRKNKTFISNRLSEINDLTQPKEWRWLPGQLNVADEATRGKSMNPEKSRWLLGPEFLRLQEDYWPKPLDKEDLEEKDNIEKDNILLTVEKSEKIIDDTRFSQWRRLIRSLSWALLFIDRCRRLCRNLTPDYERRAEISIMRQAQTESFHDDIVTIKRGLNISPSSRLGFLNPYIDETGLLRAKSRLEAASDLPLDLKMPVILDGRHYVTRLIIESMHRKLRHYSTETLINEIRQIYYILRLRGTVKLIITRCVTCKKIRARCEQPMMAGLPSSRLHHHCRPFTYCGVDLFGPMLVTIGRRTEKRWAALFTCFSIRAVHIELVSSLSTDSTILAIRRMAARRGYPKQMFSDNGTNFRGADKELQRTLREILTNGSLADEALSFGIEWRFNPPEAPHMGGAWERLIRSIKTALFTTLKARTPKEEVLATLLAEAENIVNSRPLTHVTLDPNEEEALTPNHFLLGASNGLPRPGEFSDQDLHLRKQWRTAQRLADHFWSRWLREYLPTMQIRKRWTSDRGHNVCVGDFVLVADPTSPRNMWPMGRVTATTPGRDGRVRIVDVTTRGGTLRRPVTKIVVLLRNTE